MKIKQQFVLFFKNCTTYSESSNNKNGISKWDMEQKLGQKRHLDETSDFFRHTDHLESVMSSSVAWTSATASYQVSSRYTQPSSTHLPHRGKHTADTKLIRPLHSNSSNSLSA